MKEKMIKRICEIYKTMTYDGHKPKEGLEKARCMSVAFNELEDEMNNLNHDLEWILFCIFWYSHKKIELQGYAIKSEPFICYVRNCTSGKTAIVTLEELMRSKTDDICLKAILLKFKDLCDLKKSDCFVNEVFEMVRTKNSPLYINFTNRGF